FAAARHAAADQLRQLFRGLDRRAASRLDDAAGDAAAETLLAVLEDQVRQLALAQAVHQGAGRLSLTPVHPPIERALLLEAQPAHRVVALIRADAQVGDNAVDAFV